MILLIDNYDSFSYNLYQMVGEINPDIKVIRNDEFSVEEVIALNPSHIILSPGPGRPEDAGIIEEVAKKCKDIPLLGVCLGHQAICDAYGATITYASELMHGKQSEVSLDLSSKLFKDCDEKTRVARYHSLVVDPQTLPPSFKVTSMTTDGVVMAIEHKDYPIYGVQFHPESIMTPLGRKILENFIKIQGVKS